MSNDNPITFVNTFEKVRSRGYWKFVLEPTFMEKTFFNHIRDAIIYAQKATIQLRGWDYPHIPKQEGIEILEKRVNSYTDWDYYKEVWTYFSSGQFVHLLGLREDWHPESRWFSPNEPFAKLKPQSILDFVGTTLTLTEMFLFATNLALNDRYKGCVKIKISIHNLAGRSLQVISPNRFPLSVDYKISPSDVTVFEGMLLLDMLKENNKKYAEESAIKLFKFFGNFDPSPDVIKEDQLRLLERRL